MHLLFSIPRDHSETFWTPDIKTLKDPKQQQQKTTFLMSVITSHHVMQYYICL